MKIDIKCDSNGKVTDAAKVLSVSTKDKCSAVVTVSHNSGCAVFSASKLVTFLSKQPYYFAPLLIIVGALICLMGRKFFPLTIQLLGIVFGFGVTMILFSVISMLDKQ